ncbi:MAG: ABC transporter permease [Opitutaceae bacterium]
MKLLRKIRTLFRKKKLDTDMSEEMRLHLERRTEENIASGLSPEEARYAALRKFGGVEQVKEIARDGRGLIWLDQLSQDLRYAGRALRKNPGFTLTAVLTLALGIGVNAALFTVYNAVALRSLPSRAPDELVTVIGGKLDGRQNIVGRVEPRFSYPDYLDYRAANRSFTDLIAWTTIGAALANEEAAQRDPLTEPYGSGGVMIQVVSDNYFSGLGAGIGLGREFRPEETRTPEAHPVIVLSHLFWQRHFHGDPDVLGKTLTLDRQAFTIVGVTSPEFVGRSPVPPAGWISLMMRRGLDDRADNFLELIGRLKPGVTPMQANADLDVLAQRLALQYPGERRKVSVRLEPGMRWFNLPLTLHTVGETSPLLLGFAMVLIIACLNVANLLLARGVTRQQEIGVRLTLGASRGRIVRQLFTENLLLSAAGAAAGLVLALWTLQVLRPLVIAAMPASAAVLRNGWSLLDLSPDWRIFAFVGLLAIVASAAAGLAPALHASRRDLIAALKDEGSAFGPRLSRSKLRHLLVITQVAACLTLLSCGGFFTRNFLRLQPNALGFEAKQVFRAGVGFESGPQETRAALVRFRQAIETLQSLPGVASAGVVWRVPGIHRLPAVSLRLPGAAEPEAAPRVRYTMVSAGFFETLRIPIRRGRAFTAQDVNAETRVAIVSEATAQRLWPGENAIGHTIGIDEEVFRNSSGAGAVKSDAPAPSESTLHRDYEIVGVAGDIQSENAGETDSTLLYLPLPNDAKWFNASTYVRPQSDSEASLSGIVRTALAAGMRLQFRDRLAAQMNERLLPIRALAWLFGALGAVALSMAAVGLYGVMSFAVNQRVREIGIRVALGATTEKIHALILRHGMRLVAFGAVAGLMGGGGLSLLLTKILAGKQPLARPFDWVVFAAVTMILALVALLACWLPARRAAKVDPMVALRAE